MAHFGRTTTTQRRRRRRDEDDGGGGGDDVPGNAICFVCEVGLGVARAEPGYATKERIFCLHVGSRRFCGKAHFFTPNHGICIDRLIHFFLFVCLFCVDWDVTPRGKL